jgi:hypothetical protein
LRARARAGEDGGVRTAKPAKGIGKMRVASPPALVVAALSAALGCGGVTSALSLDGAAGSGGADAPAGADTPLGADAPGGETSEGRIAEACAAVAKAQCDKRVECSGKIDARGVGVIRMFGSMAECLARQALQCESAYRAPGSGHSLATEAECAQALAAFSCAAFFANDAPGPCRPSGARVNGAACAYDTQCRSTFCTGETHAACGTCGPEPALGASCADADCGRGQLCDGATKTCRAPGAAGDGCDSSDDCGYGLVCGGGSGSAGGGGAMCREAVAAIGEPCGGMNALCDGAQGLFCSSSMGAKKCAAMTFVAAGAPCGLLAPDSFAACTAGGCYTAKGLAGAGEMGTCKANAADGAACDTATGPACELPARCVLGNGTAGVCRVPGGSCG